MPRILVIDAALPGVGGLDFVHARWQELTPALLAATQPGIVVGPLLGPGFDAIDLIERLAGLGWRGALHVLAPELPDPRLVETELQACARDIGAEIDIALTSLESAQ